MCIIIREMVEKRTNHHMLEPMWVKYYLAYQQIRSKRMFIY